MKVRVAVGAALLSAMSGLAMAADLGTSPALLFKTPPPVIAHSWTGCYLGGQVGGDWHSSHYTLDNGAGTVETFGFNSSSWIGGGQFGCEKQFAEHWVLGLEGTWSGANLTRIDTSVLIPPNSRSLGIDEIVTLTPQLGYAWDRTQIYAKGGFAVARVNIHTLNPILGSVGDDTLWQPGWTVGGGVAYMPWQGLVLGAEFNYYRVAFNRSFTANPGAFAEATTNSSGNIYAAMVRASWLFSWEARARQ
jgi:outer membrane immunogenic protein